MSATKPEKPLTKSQLVSAIAAKQGLTKTVVDQVLDGLNETVHEQLGANGPGSIVIPGLLKLRAVAKAAQPERSGVNPFTKQPITIPAKPASRKVKASVIKALKEAVALGHTSRWRSKRPFPRPFTFGVQRSLWN